MPGAPPARPRTRRSSDARGANRVALVAQVAFGVYLMAIFAALSARYWYADGGGRAPKSALYGIWNVEELTVDGERCGPPSLNDYDRRWRRVIFDAPQVVVFQRTDDSLAHYGASIDAGPRTLALTQGREHDAGARRFTVQRPARDRLLLDGEMDGHRIRMRLALVELDTFRLLNSRVPLGAPAGSVRRLVSDQEAETLLVDRGADHRPAAGPGAVVRVVIVRPSADTVTRDRAATRPSSFTTISHAVAGRAVGVRDRLVDTLQRVVTPSMRPVHSRCVVPPRGCTMS